jgi:hypothetical protein
MRWLGDKSLACSQALPPGRVPQVRTSVPGKKKTGTKPPPKLLYPDQGSVTPGVKAFEKNHFQPRYAGANLGHPSRGRGLAEAGKAEDERTANRLTELKSFQVIYDAGQFMGRSGDGIGWTERNSRSLRCASLRSQDTPAQAKGIVPSAAKAGFIAKHLRTG